MRFSWKTFLLTFGVALGIFSIVMACICTDIFRNRITVLNNYADTEIKATLDTPVRPEYESYLFFCYDKDGEMLDFAVLVRLDVKGERVLVTPVMGDYLIERDGSLFFLRSLCDTFGEDELVTVFASVTGYEVPKANLLNAREYLPENVKNATVRYLDFAEILPTIWHGKTDHFKVKECPLVTEENSDLRIIRIEKSLEAFRKSEKSI